VNCQLRSAKDYGFAGEKLMANTSPEVVASIIAAATALVAVVIGPFVTMRASKNQMLGPMRQAWINDLRDTIAEFCSVVSSRLPTGSISPDDQLRRTAQQDIQAAISRVSQLQAKITLLINPKECDHMELVRLVNAAHSAYLSDESTTVQVSALISHAQGVLKAEWNVVKK
jgi:hypothetical protein